MLLKLFRTTILVVTKLSITVAFAVAMTGATTAAFAQEGAPPQGAGPGAAGRGAQTISMLKPNLYLVAGAGAIVVVRVANEGLLLVNTKNLGQMNYDNLMAQIRTVSDKPVKYVVLSDVHQDFSGNTALFVASGAKVIAQENEKTGLATYANAAGTPGPPNVTYTNEYSIKMDGKEVAHLYHWGPAATNADTIVDFPDLKVLAMGDIFRPGLNSDYSQGGNLLDFHKTIEAVLKLDFDTMIPMNGPNGIRADLEAELKRLNGIAAAAIELVKKGTTEDQIVEQIDAVDPSFQVEKFLMNNNKVRRDAFYAEISRAAGK